jgi:hypothetical protein
MPPKKKRDQPGDSPQKTPGHSNTIPSPHRSQIKKKLFTGEKPMDED